MRRQLNIAATWHISASSSLVHLRHFRVPHADTLSDYVSTALDREVSRLAVNESGERHGGTMHKETEAVYPHACSAATLYRMFTTTSYQPRTDRHAQGRLASSRRETRHLR